MRPGDADVFPIYVGGRRGYERCARIKRHTLPVKKSVEGVEGTRGGGVSLAFGVERGSAHAHLLLTAWAISVARDVLSSGYERTFHW